jgi:hypothetical protein
MPDLGRTLHLAPLALWLATGCGPRLAPPPPPLDPAGIAAAAVAALDSNRSGAIDPAEMTHALRSGAAKIDADGNGVLTAGELEQRLRRYEEFPVDNLPLGCIVRLDGRPLAEGQVRLVPEQYFGRSRRIVLGRTDPHGIVDFKVEGNDAFGVPQGIYRIEVSKPDAAGKETVPARYNTNSQLGQEIAFDRREIEGSLRLELKSR